MKIAIKPGIFSDDTPYSGESHWIDCNLVRFRNGYPESMGGWVKYTSSTLDGVCRSAHHWHSVTSDQYTGFGTNLKYYVENGGLLTNITPLRASDVSLGTDPFSATSGSSVITVTHVAHGAANGDFVTFSGSTTFAGVPASVLNDEHQVTRIDADTYTITVSVTASSTASGGGGAVLASYQISVGSAFSITGSGWGAGFWGGGQIRLMSTLTSDPLSTTNTSTTVTVNHTSHGASDGDYITITSVGGDVNGIDQIYFESVAFEITYIDANSYSIELGAAATSTGAGGGTVSLNYYDADSTGWGVAATTSITGSLPRLWNADNFGEDLLICLRGGGLYYWDVGSSNAVLVSGISGANSVPSVMTEVAVSDARHVIGFGVNPIGSSVQDKGLIRFSSSEDYLDWDITSTSNSAGELRIPVGSEIITHLKTRQEILVWSESSLCSMQFSGAPDIYGIFTVSPRITIAGPAAKIAVNELVLWMGTDNFYIYDGRVQQLPCPIWEEVFENANFEAPYNFVAGLNRKFNEVIWFYPPSGSVENSLYVAYNYKENLWYYGSMSRTCWIDLGLSDNPRATDSSGLIFEHEVGYSDGSTEPSSALNPFIKSSDIELGEGDRYMLVNRIIPDLTFRKSSAVTPTATITLTPSNWPGAALGSASTMDIDRSSGVSADVEEFTTHKDVRLRSRAISFQISSNEVDVGWRMGTPRVLMRPDGRRS